jgi:hypothetical protein
MITSLKRVTESIGRAGNFGTNTLCFGESIFPGVTAPALASSNPTQ